jgi:hypothetical protein
MDIFISHDNKIYNSVIKTKIKLKESIYDFYINMNNINIKNNKIVYTVETYSTKSYFRNLILYSLFLDSIPNLSYDNNLKINLIIKACIIQNSEDNPTNFINLKKHIKLTKNTCINLDLYNLSKKIEYEYYNKDNNQNYIWSFNNMNYKYIEESKRVDLTLEFIFKTTHRSPNPSIIENLLNNLNKINL